MSFEIRLIQDIDTAKTLWDELSPGERLYDLWEFRYTFYKYFGYDIHFYVGYLDGKPVGLLPLQFNVDEGYLEPFGGSYMYDVQVFTSSEYYEYIPEFYKRLDLSTCITDIIGEDHFTQQLPFSSYKYIVPLNEFADVSEYLEKRFISKLRSNIRRRVKLSEQDHISIKKGEEADLDTLIEFNINTFGEKSSFHKPYRSEIFRDLLTIRCKPKLLSFVRGTELIGVSFSLIYNGIYYYLNLGVNKTASPHLFTYITYKNLELAFELGCREFDAGMDSLGWKEEWGLDKISEYKFEKDVPKK